MISVKRVYETPSQDDGYRVLVDRLWPRGVTKAEAEIDAWLKAIAPSTELRKWLHSDPSRWREFRSRYAAELKGHEAIPILCDLKRRTDTGSVTLITSVRNPVTHAHVLRDVLLKMASN